MFSTFDLCLLLYVIRLAGWLKHCNLSLWVLLRFPQRLKLEPAPEAALQCPIEQTFAHRCTKLETSHCLLSVHFAM